MLENISKEYFDKGVFVFENGKRLYIEEIQYSYDTTYWEDTFIPYEHQDPRAATESILGHKYRRVRHAGDTNFQLPEYIVAEDGKTPVFKVEDNVMYVKYQDETDDKFVELADFNVLKGDKGDVGADGRGWNIDLIGYWYEKPACLGNTVVTPCIPCGDSPGTAATSSVGGTFMSLGDGLHTITLADIAAVKFRSSDGVLWVGLTAADENRETRYMADDAIGTGMIDYRDMDDAVTRGKVYINYDCKWYYLFNVSIPLYKLAPTAAYFAASENGFYMEDYVGDTYVAAPADGHSIYLDASFDLRVKEDSIEPKHFKTGSFDDGFEEGALVGGYKSSPIRILASDFAGFGLATYVSDADTYLDIQVDVTDLNSDGLGIFDDSLNQADGETRYKLQVQATDLVDVSLSGLTTFANTDGFNDLIVMAYNGLIIDTNGLNVEPDELSVSVLGLGNKVAVKTYVAGNDGILATHLNPSLVGDGLTQNVTTKALEVFPDQLNNTIEVSTARGVFVPDNGIQGIHLNDDTCDNTKGLEVIGDKLTVKIDDTTIGFDGSGKLELKTGYLTNRAVTAITQGATTLRDSVEFAKLDTTYIDMNVDLTASPNKVAISADLDLAALEAQLLVDGFVNVAGTYITGTAAMGANTDVAVKAYVDAADALDVKLDTEYGTNMKVTTSGLLLKAPDGTWRKLIVADNFGQLGTTDIF